MNVWDDVKKEDLADASESLSALAEIIGVKAAKAIVQAFGGSTLYIPMPEALNRRRRDCRIFAEFDGGNHRALATRYNLSCRQIRNIIQQQRDQRSGQVPRQQELF